jgi:hypothetical protein
LNLPLETSFDFDAGSGFTHILDKTREEKGEVLSITPPTRDIYYGTQEIEGQEEYALYPEAFSFLTMWGKSSPTLKECLEITKQNEPILLSELEPGQYLCLQTSSANTGFIFLEDIFEDPQNNWAPTLAISYSLWDPATGAEIKNMPIQALHSAVISALGLDLDYYGNHRYTDITFALPNKEQVQILPVQTTRLSFWGTATIPTYQDCAALTMSTEAITVERHPNRPIFVCFQTEEGRLGRLVFYSVIDDPDALLELKTEEPLFMIDSDTWGQTNSPLATLNPQAAFNTLHLPIGSGFDFDSASAISGHEQHDLLFEYSQSNIPALIPSSLEQTTTMAAWGMSEPSLHDCQSAPFTYVAVPLSDIPPGSFVCLQTNLDQIGLFRVNEISSENSIISLSFKLWNGNQAETMVFSPLLTIIPGFAGETGIDLDTFNGTDSVDIRFSMADDKYAALIPANGSSLALWGTSFPSYQDCASLPLLTNPLLVPRRPHQESLTDGIYVCYRTSQGHLGRLVYLDEVGGQFVFDAETWAGT